MSEDSDIDLELLRSAIRHYKMMDIWGDSVRDISIDEKRARARKRAIEAKDAFIRLMRSASNDGSPKYRIWAVKKALGLRTSTRYTAQAIGGKHWRGWGGAKIGGGPGWM
jgi:hypothetical protein